MSEWIMHITRTQSNDKQTTGEGLVLDPALDTQFRFVTMELPWLNNQFQVSCIPTGTYDVKKRFSKTYGHHFHVVPVANRSMILIHIGNYHTNTKGCILPGREFKDLNKDGLRDVTASGATMNELNRILPDTFKLVITETV